MSGAFVVQLGSDAPSEHGFGGIPLLSALQFFITGTSEVLRAFAAVAAGAAVLVGVTVYSVSRMSVRDRLSTIRIVRATGGRSRTVLGLFAVRALLLTLLGVALGYAMGVIIINAVVNLAVASGLPTSLSIEAGPRAVRVLGALYVAVVGVGGLAGVIAAWPAARRPPGRLTDDEPSVRGSGSLPEVLTPSLLHWRALVPTTATLTTFTAFVVLVAAMAGVAGPLTTAEGATITQPGTTNPINSGVPEAYAEALQARGINASAEILLFEMTDDGPILARGAEYEAFESVTDSRIIRGRAPEASSEALLGVDLARTRGIEVGEVLTLGGSTRPALTRVEVVGTFAAPGPFDDQVLVSLPTARHLGVQGPDQVQLVRADRRPPAGNGSDPGTGTGIGVIDLAVADRVAANTSFTVQLTLRNDGLSRERASVPVEFGDQRRDVTVELARGRQRTVELELTAGRPGTHALKAGDATADIRVVDPDSIVISGVPPRAPPGSTPVITVTTATGAPAAGASVTVGNRTVTTGENGRVRVPLAATGRVEITARLGTERTTEVVDVTPGATRALSTTLQVRPSEPTLTTRPEARAVLSNPWSELVNATVRIDGSDRSFERGVSVPPGGQVTVSTRLARQPPGPYDVRVALDDTTVGEVEYRVAGDRRIVSALATSGGGGTTGISQAIEVVFGNFRILVGALLGLAAFMTVGGTTATFAQAVHARRRTIGIHRATGASQSRVLRLVLADAVRIGVVASVAALVLALLALQVLEAVGYLTVFGIGLRPVPSPTVAVGILLGSLAVTLLGATLTTLSLLRVSPASLLSGADDTVKPRSIEEGSR
ncbi:MAG: FtsX-like permease family protein [Haloarculaceae archaeon]